MNQRQRLIFRSIAAGMLAVGFVGAPSARQEPARAPASPDAPYRAVVKNYCLSCHNSKSKAGGLELTGINTQDLRDHSEVWEKVARKLRARQMPPPGSRRPDEATHIAALNALEASLDNLAV